MRPTRRALLAGALGMGVLTTMRGDELDDLFRLGSAPTQAQNMTYRQGTVVAWDPNTLQNRINVGGNTFTDLPVLGVGEATTIRAGSTVGLMCVQGEGGETWAVIGRLVTPNTPAATDAVSLLNSQTYAAYVSTAEVCTNGTLGDLATVGPRVTVPIGPTGRVAVIASAHAAVTGVVAGGSSNAEAAIGVWLDGANTYQPAGVDFQGYEKITVFGTYTGTSMGIQGPPAVVAVFEGLAPGGTTFTVKYSRTVTGAGSCVFTGRSLLVFRL